MSHRGRASLLLLDDRGSLTTKRCMEHPLVVEGRVVRYQVAVLELRCGSRKVFSKLGRDSTCSAASDRDVLLVETTEYTQ
jgi:hypothetical protein